MAGLIEQIQRDALNTDINVAALLRRVKLAAAKLNIDDVGAWVDAELNGYAGQEVPPYRVIRGAVVAYNPFNGWIPVVGDLAEELSEFSAREAISSMEDLAESDDRKTIIFEFPPEMVGVFNEAAGVRFGRYAVRIGRGNIINAIEAVRTKVLELAIELERRGVTGVDFSFTNEEKSRAKGEYMSITTGPIGTFVGNMGTGNTVNDITVGNVDIQAATALGKQIAEYLPALEREGIASDEVKTQLQAIEAEVVKAEPSQSKIRSAFTDVRNTLSGAGGSLLASGIVAGITKLLGG